MTNEEAIKWLIAIKDKYIHGGDEAFDERRKEALDMAIKALEDRQQGACEQCVYNHSEVCHRCFASAMSSSERMKIVM